jgi:hypothetical protein
MSLFSNEIGWSTTPNDMTVRIGDALVHRVHQLVGSTLNNEQAVLECGVVVLRRRASETKDLVDCMGCMIQRTSAEIEAEIAWVERFNETITPW